jgi:hypothetical protein
MRQLEKDTNEFYNAIKRLIEESKKRISVTVNSELTLLNWDIGKNIKDEIFGGDRAEYGRKIIVNLSVHLSQEYGSGWGEKHLRHCLHFVETFSEREIVYTLWRIKLVDSENPPVGLILCTGKTSEHVELMQLHHSNIKIAEYLTILPSKDLLLEKFHKAVEMARSQLENQEIKN